MSNEINVDRKTLEGFGDEWMRFDQSSLAFFIYLPLAKFAWVAEKFGIKVSNFPLSLYRNNSFNTMRTDALDRFGTRLEQRFSQQQIKVMMEKSGLEHVEFSDSEPFWCAAGYRK